MKKTTIEKAIDLLYNIQECLANKQIDDGESERRTNTMENACTMKLNLQHLDTVMYVAGFNGYNDGKIRFYDSNHDYICYIEAEHFDRLADDNGTDFDDELWAFCQDLRMADNIDDLCETLGIFSYTACNRHDHAALCEILQDLAEYSDILAEQIDEADLYNATAEKIIDFLDCTEMLSIIGDYVVYIWEE